MSAQYNTKEMWELPWQHFAIDWVQAYDNGMAARGCAPRVHCAV